MTYGWKAMNHTIFLRPKKGGYMSSYCQKYSYHHRALECMENFRPHHRHNKLLKTNTNIYTQSLNCHLTKDIVRELIGKYPQEQGQKRTHQRPPWESLPAKHPQRLE